MNLEHLRETVLLRCRLDPSRPVVVGVSGGPDSLCLLAALAQLGFKLIVAHFDHRLRADSAMDAVVVEQLAGRLGLPFASASANVADFAHQERLSVEAAARALRYRFLFAQAQERSAQAVAVGHTADDQVETVLMHLLRGSGLNGLTGMDYRRVLPEWDAEIPLVRPLLDFWREDTLAFCREQGLQPVMDQSNSNKTFTRNRVRHELIPLLETYNPQVRRALWRMARNLAGDEAVVTAAVEDTWPACLESAGEGFVQLRLDRLSGLQEGVQRGVIRRAAGMLAPLPDGLDFDAVERTLALARESAAGVQVDLNDDLRAWAEGDLLVLARSDAALPTGQWPQLAADFTVQEIPVPGSVKLPNGWQLSAEVVDAESQTPPGDPWQAWLDLDSLDGPLVMRCARAGERFLPLGMDGRSIKLSDFWTNVKLPRRARARWPILSVGESIAWLPGHRLAHPFRINESTRRALVLRLYRAA